MSPKQLQNVAVITSTAAITTSSSNPVVARSDRRALTLQNSGAGDITISSVTPAVAGAGLVLKAASGAGKGDGGIFTFPDGGVPNNALYAIGGASTTLSILEG